MTKLLVTGSKGQLGSEIRVLANNYPDFEFIFTDVSELDICNKTAIEQIFQQQGIDRIINCAAYTAVDKAESEPELADKINYLAVKNLAEVAQEHGVGVVHISTDYVFDGRGHHPYPVDYSINPLNVYGLTKSKGEKILRTINPINSVIIRTSWVYSSFGSNFVKTMLRLGKEKEQLSVINDQVGTPTYAADLAKFILDHVVKEKSTKVETYHFTNEGVCSWYDFAVKIMELGKRNCKVNPIPTVAYPTPAQRPFYSLLDKVSLKKHFNTEIPHWEDGLKRCLIKLS